MGNLLGFESDKQSLTEFVMEDLQVGKGATKVLQLVDQVIQTEDDYLEFINDFLKFNNKLYFHLLEFAKSRSNRVV